MTEHLCCLGFDPRLSDIPVAFQQSGSVKRCITDFWGVILDATADIKAVKINFAYFEQYGCEGMEALKECLVMARSCGKFIIADVKRGDIDITNTAIIEGLKNSWGVDGATFHPWMGVDTFSMLANTGLRPYFLIRTSNVSYIQTLSLHKSKDPLYLHVLNHFTGHFPEGGFVIGGTDLEALSQCLERFKKLKTLPYLLIPGVGRQGADCSRLMELITLTYRDQSAERVVVAVSSGIIYAPSPVTSSVHDVSLAIKNAARMYVEKLSLNGRRR